jgi:hypothetical protein
MSKKREEVKGSCVLFIFNHDTCLLEKYNFDSYYVARQKSIEIKGYRYYCYLNEPYFACSKYCFVTDMNLELEALEKYLDKCVENVKQDVSTFQNFLAKNKNKLKHLLELKYMTTEL